MKTSKLDMLRSTAAMFAAFALTAAGLLAIAPSAYAQSKPLEVIGERQDEPTRRVSYADLNLATADGEKTLNRRVGRAVSSVCNEALGPVVDFHGFWSCRSGSWAGARPQIALAVQRARQLATTGSSDIVAVSISVVPFAE